MKRFFSAAIVFCVFLVLTGVAAAQTSWLDPAWAYRRPITISNSSGQELTDYQALVTLDSSFNFTLSDGNDLRVTEDDGTTQIPFWIEEWNEAGTIARIWVKIPSLPIGDNTIYLYYGNSGAASASNGDTTFELFDDDWAQFTSADRNPVHSAGQPWWESNVSYPVVFEDTSFLPDRPRYHMLYDGHAVIGHAKGYATSPDLNT